MQVRKLLAPRLIKQYLSVFDEESDHHDERCAGRTTILSILESATDPTQAAVLLALQWLAYVYPGSELQIEKTLNIALPEADSDLVSRAAHFFDQADINDHVQALEWVAATLSEQQIPALVEIAWRVLLADYQLPAHVPLALRILGRVLNISQADVLVLGEQVFNEVTEAETEKTRAPLLPLDPRYLDRVEWRLHGTAEGRMVPEVSAPGRQRRYQNLILGFVLGTVFGALVAVALIFGPLQLGRVKVPVLLHDFPEPASIKPAETAEPAVIEIEPIAETEEQRLEPEPVSAGQTAIEADADNAEPAVAITPIVELDTAPVTDESTITSEPVLMEVTASLLNVRQQASVDAPVIIKLGEGARVWAYPETEAGAWIMVQVDGQKGFASADFLEPVAP